MSKMNENINALHVFKEVPWYETAAGDIAV